jgi:hypothetical protein
MHDVMRERWWGADILILGMFNVDPAAYFLYLILKTTVNEPGNLGQDNFKF